MPILRKIVIFLTLAILIFFGFYSAAQAQTEKESESSPSAQASPAGEITKSDYKLPYPGMLPDHPLYKLKVLRNKILLFFNRDPLKKAALHLQMADKEFLMALKLAEKDKLPLAVHTAFKAEHHMTQMVDEIKRYKYSKGEIHKGLMRKAYQAKNRHLELLAGMMDRAEGEEQKNLEIIWEFSTRNNGELHKLEEEFEEEQKAIEERETSEETVEKEE